MPTTRTAKSNSKPSSSRASKSAADAVASEPANAPPTVPAPPNVNLVIDAPCFGGQIFVLYAASIF
jgi:hypothetical protein